MNTRVETTPQTFDQSEELVMPNLLILQINFQSEQKCEQKLVFLVQSSHGVRKHVVRQVLDDVCDPFWSYWRRAWSGGENYTSATVTTF